MRVIIQHDSKLHAVLSGLKIRLYPEKCLCKICGKETYVLNTTIKNCYSFNLGRFTLVVGYLFCAKHKYVSIEPNKILKYHSELVAEIVDKGYRITFDLLVKIGLRRYRDHRQLEEIQAFLKYSSAKINLPVSTIGMVAKRFLEYCKRLHKEYEYKIKEDIKSNGGYILQFDGSTEQLCGKLSFVLLDGLSGHVLSSEMIESENYAILTEFLDEIKLKYGNPLATLSDLKPCFLKGCKDTFLKKVIFILCHYHFLRTFKDDFIKLHNFIKHYLTKTCKINSELNEKLKKLKKENDFKVNKNVIKNIGTIEKEWIDSKNVLQTYHNVLEWILEFKQDSTGKGLPFDLPYLDLYNRLKMGEKLIKAIFRKAGDNIKHHDDFCATMNSMEKINIQAKEFRKNIRLLKYLRTWFNRLRGSLFYGTQEEIKDALAPLSKRYNLTEEEAKLIPENIEQYLKEVENELAICQNEKKIKVLTKLKKQTEKYKDNLKLPILDLIIDGINKKFIPPRTNNFMESFFRLIKCLLRRNTGRSRLTKEFGSVGDLLPYYVSMSTHKTFKAIFDDERKLAEEFANLSVDKLAALKKDAA